MNEAASSVEPEVKTLFATVDEAAVEKLLYEKDAKTQWCLSTKIPKNMDKGLENR